LVREQNGHGRQICAAIGWILALPRHRRRNRAVGHAGRVNVSGSIQVLLHFPHREVFRKYRPILLYQFARTECLPIDRVLLRKRGRQLTRIGIRGQPLLQDCLGFLAAPQVSERRGQIKKSDRLLRAVLDRECKVLCCLGVVFVLRHCNYA